MNNHRSTYINQILERKDPYEATETLRIRLSQAKLLNTNLYLFLNQLADLRRNYNQQLRKIIIENEDLNSMLRKQMIENNVLTAEEMQHFTFNSLGEIEPLWNTLVSELKLDLAANTKFSKVIEDEVILGIKNSVEKNSNWGTSKHLHSKLSKVAVSLKRNKDPNTHAELQSEWDADKAKLFQIFETMDYERLYSVKDCLLKYQSGYTDYILKTTEKCDTYMTQFLEFNPEKEIQRFANDASNYKFSQVQPGNNAKYAPSNMNTPNQERGSFNDKTSPSRFASASTVIKHDMGSEQPIMLEDSTTYKNMNKTQKLKSKMGSIFGKNKLKSKKSQQRLSSSPEKPPLSKSFSSASASTNYSSRKSQMASTMQTPQVDIQNRESGITDQISSSNISTPKSFQQQPKIEQAPIASMSQPALIPNQKDKPLPDIKQNKKERDIVSDQNAKSTPEIIQHKPLHITSPNSSKSQTPRQWSTSSAASTTNNEPPAYSPHLSNNDSMPNNTAANTLGSQQMMQPQLTGELTALQAQTTGATGTSSANNSLFQHLPDDFSIFGLNASIAEVLNATFKDGVLTSSQLVGEVALNYVKNTVMNTPLPIGLNLQVTNASTFNKVILNQAFMEKVADTEYKVNPQFIDGRTLGAMKYSIDNTTVPVVIHPIWKFEPHQASVVLTVGLSNQIPESINELTLSDFTVMVNIAGTESTSALSKPQGTFNREKNRITWKFKEPLTISRDGENVKLIGRFMTNGQGFEPSDGVMLKFVIREQQGQQDASINIIGSKITLSVQEYDVENPFGGEWQPMRTNRTLASGNYIATS